MFDDGALEMKKIIMILILISSSAYADLPPCRDSDGDLIKFRNYYAIRYYRPTDKGDHRLFGDGHEEVETVFNRVLSSIADYEDCIANTSHNKKSPK